ncbi:MAG TPA: transposase [Ilumatobacter sp.]|nr:transposase [Ilumatobacter sp.]
MNRGIDHQPVFLAAGDARLFLWLMGEAAELRGVEVHAYCLMENHYHLLVHCPEGGLSEFMQRVGARYTRAVNTRVARDGPLFRGRFHSILIDSPEYLDLVGRYIHRNPLDVRPAVPLDRYRWSSFGAYVGAASSPEWLRTDVLEAMHADRYAMRTFVEGNLAPMRVTAAMPWAIKLAVSELDHEALGIANSAQVERTVALALLDGSSVEVQQSVSALLGELTDGARRTALSRARRRVADQPWMADILGRVRHLAA